MLTGVWKTEGWRPLGRPRPRWRILLKFILKYNGMILIGLIWLTIESSDSYSAFDSIKFGEFGDTFKV